MNHSAILVAILAVACSVPAWGGNIIFYDSFESEDTSGWWAAARVGETGQKSCVDGSGSATACAGTGQDGEHRGGVPWPEPRFEDNFDGTVADMLTGLIWLKNANCWGEKTWTTALADAGGLASGACGLTDGSIAGEWRLPSVSELQSLIDYEYFNPALSNAAGTSQWSEGDAFTSVQSDYYWASSSQASFTEHGWYVYLYSGGAYGRAKTNSHYLWPVRGGQPQDSESWGPAQVGKTGQETCFDESGTPIACGGTGQNGELQTGVTWPDPRFEDNGNGTVTDMLTGLIWLKSANCFGLGNWATALTDANTLNSGECGLSDASVEGDWRLPSVNELQSLAHLGFFGPALSDAAGTGSWTEGDPFTGVQNFRYWSATSYFFPFAWSEDFYHGSLHTGDKGNNYYVWPVRGAQ